MNLVTIPQVEVDLKYKDDLVINREVLDFVATDNSNDVRIYDQFTNEARLYDLTPLAKQQLCNMVGIPTQYFDRCPDWLRKKNMDYHLSNYPKKMLARTYKDHETKGNVVRGFLGAKYGIIDYKPTVDAINNVVGTGLIKNPVSMRESYSDDVLRIHIVDKSAEVMEGSFSGVMITNSELGLHKLDVALAVYTLVCKNGLVVPRMITGFSRKHVGCYETLNQDLYSAIKGFGDTHDKVTSMLENANKNFVEKDDAIKYINTLKEFPIQWRKDMIDRINKRDCKTRAWHICYDATQLAQQYCESMRKLIEEEAGAFLMQMSMD